MPAAPATAPSVVTSVVAAGTERLVEAAMPAAHVSLVPLNAATNAFS